MSEITLKSVKDLLDKKFLIPSYQRGYRWTKDEVEALLNDLYEYSEGIKLGINRNSQFYCLQPLVIKKIDSEYEVIDGQQRLTTIFLILKFLETHAKNALGIINYPVFSLNYSIRTNFVSFFESEGYKKESDENLDFLHISNAYKTIENWFGTDIDSARKRTEFCNLLYADKFTAKFIWYEIPTSENAYEVFKRLNSGKLSLTNSELVKALILNDEDKNLSFNQEDIAREWEFIENHIENNEFWYFINANPEDKAYESTRMDFILEVLLLSKNIKVLDNYFIFSEMNSQIKQNGWKSVWEDIKATFRTLQSWYADRKLYHYIGFLMNAKVSAKTSLGSLINDYVSLDKDTFFAKVKSLCKQIVMGNGEKICFSKLRYGLNNNEIHNILLAFNLATTQNQISETSRYPFKRHFEASKSLWSLEHIHAQKERQKNWNEEELEQLKSDMKSIAVISQQKADIEDFANYIDAEKLKDEEVYGTMMAVFMGEEIKLTKNDGGKIEFVSSDFEKDDSLMNLALLQADKNAAFNNKTFLEKRRILSNYENAEQETEFIPICTRNVFFKHYSPNATNPLIWDREAGKDYVRAIMSVVGKFVGAKSFDNFDKQSSELEYGLQ